MLVTIAHEGGHAVVGLLAGRRLAGIRLHSDTSGLTVTRGRPSGPGMVAMLMAGYLAPAALGLVAAVMLLNGYALGLMWVCALGLGLMLLQIRNFHGFAVVIAAIAILVVVSWYAPIPVQALFAYLLTWILLFAAPRPVIELARQRQRARTPNSDPDQLARLTRVPAGGWLMLFLAANCAGLVVGTAVLLPAVADLFRAVAALGGN